jgi:diadenosine tetraphosphate (Ap4A) HIT family hydrolase
MAVVMNIDPSRPGHALVCSHRPVQYFSELTPDELTSMGLLTQAYQRFWNNHPSNVGKQFEYVVFINDGPHAGQSVPHFHMQIVPVNKKQPISKGMVRHAIALKPMNEKGKPVSADFVKNNIPLVYNPINQAMHYLQRFTQQEKLTSPYAPVYA